MWIPRALISLRCIVYIDKHTLRQILQNISEAGVEFDDMNWRKVAHSANELSMKQGRRRFLFYGADECQQFIVEDIFPVTENDSIGIFSPYSEDFNIFY